MSARPVRISRKELDEVKWSALAAQSDFPYFMSLSYLDAVSPNWEALIINDYEAVLPIFPQQKFGLSVSLQPLFLRSLDVLGNKDFSFILFAELKSIFALIDLNFTTEVKDKLGEIDAKSFVFQVIPLEEGYEGVRENYSENVRRKVKQFQKQGGTIALHSEPEKLIQLFQSEKANVYETMTDEAYNALITLMQASLKNGKGKLFAAMMNGEIEAMAFFIFEETATLYLKGIANEAGRKSGALQAVFDRVIQESCTLKKRIFDFGGSHQTGLSTFNRKFGAKDFQYFRIKQVGLKGITGKMLGKFWKLK